MIGVWIIEKVTGYKFNPEKKELAQELGRRIRTEMEYYAFHFMN